jgi:ribosomal protein S18 acetylase RimI-like enzyme
LRRETNRFELLELASPGCGRRLTFRGLDEVGEAAFAAAIARFSAGTLDREIGEERERLGAEPAARALFEQLERLEYARAWWRLAFAPAGELAGLVMPAKIPAAGTLGDIGVVPEQRGRGYVDDLLAEGTATLLTAGVDRIVVDTDRSDAPMAAALHRAGYAQFATRREYAVDLAHAS